MAGVNMSEVARPQRMEYVRMKCHSSAVAVSTLNFQKKKKRGHE